MRTRPPGEWGPSKHKTLYQCGYNVGPASQTVGQHFTYIGSANCVSWDTYCHLASGEGTTGTERPPANTILPSNVKLRLGQRRRRWTKNNSTLGGRVLFAS